MKDMKNKNNKHPSYLSRPMTPDRNSNLSRKSSFSPERSRYAYKPMAPIARKSTDKKRSPSPKPLP